MRKRNIVEVAVGSLGHMSYGFMDEVSAALSAEEQRRRVAQDARSDRIRVNSAAVQEFLDALNARGNPGMLTKFIVKAEWREEIVKRRRFVAPETRPRLTTRAVGQIQGWSCHTVDPETHRVIDGPIGSGVIVRGRGLVYIKFGEYQTNSVVSEYTWESVPSLAPDSISDALSISGAGLESDTTEFRDQLVQP